MSYTGDLIKRVAADIPDDVDLGDQGDVIRALCAKGWAPKDYDAIFDDVIDRARARRQRERIGTAVGLAGIVALIWFCIVALAPEHAMAATAPAQADSHELLKLTAFLIVCIIVLTTVGIVVLNAFMPVNREDRG
jgi:hypothetical protein